jgi:hypothetical protein
MAPRDFKPPRGLPKLPGGISNLNTGVRDLESKVNDALARAADALQKPTEPLEMLVDKTTTALVDMLENVLINNQFSEGYRQVREAIPGIDALDLPTPLGEIRTPKLELPELELLTLSEQRREAIRLAVAIDLSSAVGVVPGLGDIVADIVEDTYGAQLRATLTPGEFARYMKFDKLGPSTIAILRAFMAERKA